MSIVHAKTTYEVKGDESFFTRRLLCANSNLTRNFQISVSPMLINAFKKFIVQFYTQVIL